MFQGVRTMKLNYIITGLLVILLLGTLLGSCSSSRDSKGDVTEAEETETAENFPGHAAVLTGPYETAHDVTAACLDCHQEQADDFMKTIHWQWEGPSPMLVGHDSSEIVGKKTTINNFCIAIPSNEQRCSHCHAGYGWKDSSFDFSDAENIDCLVCHDNSGQYKKAKTTGGYPEEGVDLLVSAQSVGAPQRENCGACHYFAGGGNNVKKGDLYTVMNNPEPADDVHMGKLDFTCQACHTTEDHKISGSSLHTAITEGPARNCIDCHKGEPHEDGSLNAHSQSIACQTCHIPEFSRSLPTKVYWDWSTAGRKNDEGKPYTEKDENGVIIYDTKKGSFEWEQNVRPNYAWWNGKIERMLIGDAYEETPVALSSPVGTIEDTEAKIYPFKIMRGKQAADTETSVMLIPHLFGTAEAPTPYWGNWNWEKAFEEGMEVSGLSYSGSYEWVETYMYMAINHEVAPASDALQCMDCHNGGIDFEALGYSDDPMTSGGR